eukprot:4937682-Amphidinium_carterae.1
MAHTISITIAFQGIREDFSLQTCLWDSALAGTALQANARLLSDAAGNASDVASEPPAKSSNDTAFQHTTHYLSLIEGCHPYLTPSQTTEARRVTST